MSQTAGLTFFLLFCTLLILLLSSFIIWFVYQHNTKIMLNNKEFDKLKIENENNILHAQVEMQEQTFINISREIHDNIGQKLTLAKLYLINSEKGRSEKHDEAFKIIGTAIADLRDLSRTLSSDIITDSGLIEAILFEVSQIEKTNIFKVLVQISGERIFLDAKRELIIFRIVQEALHNIIKHSEAKKITIDICYSEMFLKIQVCDDGKGFEKIDSKGQGLTNIQARAKNLGGECNIISSFFQGTIIQVEIPINEITAEA